MFCSSNIFLCQELLSSELSFVQHRKHLLSELVRLEGFITLTDFQFKFLPIDIIHHTRISPWRKNMRQNEKALLLALISFLSLNRLCPKHIIIVQSSPGTHYFYSFLWEILPRTSKRPEPHYCLLFLSENNAPDHIIFG